MLITIGIDSIGYQIDYEDETLLPSEGTQVRDYGDTVTPELRNWILQEIVKVLEAPRQHNFELPTDKLL